MATTNTISGLLDRIFGASKTIWNSAKSMSLVVPAGSYWDFTSKTDKAIIASAITSTDSAALQWNISSSTKATYDLGIDAVAAAINAMNVQKYLEKATSSSTEYLSGNQTLNASLSVVIPVGYNKTEFTVSAATLASLTGGTADAKHIYKDKTAWVDGAQLKGTLENVYLYTPPPPNGYGNGSNLKVSIDSESTTELLNTNIPYRITLTTDAVTGGTSSNGTVGVLTNITIGSYNVYSGPNSTGKTATKYLKLTPTVGYYDSAWSTNIKYDPVVPTTVTIKRYAAPDGGSSLVANTLTIPAGYYSKDVTITPLILDRDDNVESILNYTDITLEGDYTFTTEGVTTFSPGTYANNAYDYFGKVTMKKAVMTTADSGKITVTTGGWINAGDYGKVYGDLTALAKSNISNAAASSGTIDVTLQLSNLALNGTKYAFKITVPSGYHTANGDVTKIYSLTSAVHSLTTAGDIFGYNDNKFGGSSSVTSEVTTISKLYGKMTDAVTTAGWTPTFSNTTYFKILDWVRASSTEKTTDYYTVGTPGWVKANTFIGTSLSTTSTYDPVNAGSNLSIAPGTILVKGLTINAVTAGTATYTITANDLSNADKNTNPTKITISATDDTDGTVSTYMTSVTVDMGLILEELQKI